MTASIETNFTIRLLVYQVVYQNKISNKGRNLRQKSIIAILAVHLNSKDEVFPEGCGRWRRSWGGWLRVALREEGLEVGVDGHEALELRHLGQLLRRVLLVQRVDHLLQTDHLRLQREE